MHFSTEEEHTFTVDHDGVFIPCNLENVTMLVSRRSHSEHITYVVL